MLGLVVLPLKSKEDFFLMKWLFCGKQRAF